MSGTKRSTPQAGAGSAVSDTDDSALDDLGVDHARPDADGEGAGRNGARRNAPATDPAASGGAASGGAASDGAASGGAASGGAASDGAGPATRRPSPSPSPSAIAASRARRIGGRPAPTSSPRPGDQLPAGLDPAVDAATVADPVTLGKPSPTRSRSASAARVAGSTARASAAPTPSKAAPNPGATTLTPAAPPEDTARLRRRVDRLRWTPAAVLGLAVVALLVLLVAFSDGVYWAKPGNSSAARDKVQEKVLASAKTCFASLNSYDYRTLDASLAAGLKCTTGKFTSDYRTAFKTQITANAPTAKATQAAQVNTAGVASISPDGKQWVVLIYGQLQVSNVSTAKKSPRIDPFGAVVTLDEVASQWLISKVGTDVGSGLGN
jgi:hypothetical protein